MRCFSSSGKSITTLTRVGISSSSGKGRSARETPGRSRRPAASTRSGLARLVTLVQSPFRSRADSDSMPKSGCLFARIADSAPVQAHYGAAILIGAFAFAFGAGAFGPEAATATETSIGAAMPPPGAAESLTVEQCVALARREAPSVAAAGFDRQASESDSAAIATNGRPSFSIRSGATVAPRGFYDPAVTNLGDYEMKAALEWTVADGGRRARDRRRGALELAAARGRLDLESLVAGRRAAGLAVGLLRSSELEMNQREAYEWLARLGALVRSGVASGSRSASDSVRVALERDQVAADLETTLLDRETARLELQSLVGRDVLRSATIIDPSAASGREPTSSDSTRLLESIERQPEVALARINESTARLDLLDARRSASPQIDVSLDAGLAGTDLTGFVPAGLRASDPDATVGDRLRRDLGASAAIHVRVPFLNSALRPARTAREAAEGASGIRSESAQREQRALALTLLARWKANSRRTAAARTTSDRAEINLLKMKSLYAGGSSSLLDLLDARRVFDEARQRLTEARWDERLARFQVEDRR